MGGSRRWWVGWEAEGRLWLPLENSTGSSTVSSVSKGQKQAQSTG